MQEAKRIKKILKPSMMRGGTPLQKKKQSNKLFFPISDSDLNFC
jgi:hypothetical protein